MRSAATDERSIRIFVSSTFRDMHAEREELVKFVFPRIRRLCEERGVAWAEVDLRWGVTDEQKAEGAVLPICLAEIDRSRPYFIGLLGHRYGWVPESLPEGLTEQLPWLRALAGRSVTELEMLHGVLDAPPGERHAFFYLRDDEASEGWAEDEQHRALLAKLKERIRAADVPSSEYTSPRGLAELVLADLTALVDRLHPADDVPDTLQREAAAHRSFGAAQTLGRARRETLLAQIDLHAGSTHPPLLLTGDAGAGMSSVASSWLDEWETAHPDDAVIEHHVGATADASDWIAMARRLRGELDGSPVDAPPGDAAAERAALFAAIARAGAVGRRTVILVDRADLLDDRDGAPDLTWLPRALPPFVRVLVTAAGARTAEAARHRGWPVLVVPPLDEAERRETIRTFLGRFAKGLDEVHVARIVAAEATGNELFLVTLLDELRQHGEHFTLGAEIDRFLAATTVDDLLALVLARYEQDFERDRPGLVRDSMRAIASARRGLTEPELLDLLGTSGDPLPHAVWSPLLLAAEAGLVTRSGMLRFATESHRRAVERRYLPTDADRADAHRALATTFSAYELGPRVVEELPWHQLAAGDVTAMVATLSDLRFTDAAYRQAHPDLRRLWARAAEHGHDVVAGYRSVIADPAADVEAAWQVARLVTDAGHPTEAAALNRFLVTHYRAAGEDDVSRRRLRAALVNLGAALWTTGELAPAEAALQEAADLAAASGDDRVRQAALGNLGLCRRDRGDLVGASAAFTADEELCRRLGDSDGLQASLGNHAQVQRQLGDDVRALELMAEQEEVCRATGDSAGVARALAGQGTVLGDRGDLAGALARFSAFGAVAREMGDLHGLAESMVSEIHTLRQLGRRADAATRAGEAESLVRRTGDQTLLARVLDAQARIAVEESRWADAARLADEAVLTARSAGVTAPLILALGMLGTARRELGDHAGARAAHSEEERIAREVGDPAAVATAQCNLATVDIVAGDLPSALARYAAAEPVLRERSLHMVLLPLYANRWQVHLHGNDVPAAIADLRACAASADVLGADEQQRDLLVKAAELMYSAGAMADTTTLWQTVAAACRRLGDDAGLQRALGELALVVMGAGELDRADSLLAEQEEICRRIGEQRGLAACVGNRAILLRQRGDLAGALRCVEEQYTIAAASGDGQGALFAVANRGDVLGAMGRTAEALAALDEARRIAAANGLTPMVAQLDQMIAALRARG